MPAEMAIEAEVDLRIADGGYFPQALIAEAHEICPYSKATRGNIHVAINLV